MIALLGDDTQGGRIPPGRIYISTGIHGDEPAGPLAALQLLQENRWPAERGHLALPLPEPDGLCAQHAARTRRALI